ncbi:hypothetical protein [Enterococcus sp. 5H]|uniref:hypothetical protein n=1 Tax=Enterococcus sp. 5H TaxID=1229490 RepID=UPI0023022010|nr:hypothetical protein [Enterococcus sp. 5H]MDA9472042.1 hypothetical protein [Enterococcus sp. 5H]
MKKRTSLGLEILQRIEKGRIQLFNGHFYRLVRGKVIRQFICWEHGQQIFEDFGKEQRIEKIFQQIKLLFDPTGKIVATRTMSGEPLFAKKESIWQGSGLAMKYGLSDVLRIYHETEAVDFCQWLKEMKRHCYTHYVKT